MSAARPRETRPTPPSGSALESPRRLLAGGPMCWKEMWPGDRSGCPVTCTPLLSSSCQLLGSESAPLELSGPTEGREPHSTLLLWCCLPRSSGPHSPGRESTGGRGGVRGRGCLQATVCSQAARLPLQGGLGTPSCDQGPRTQAGKGAHGRAGAAQSPARLSRSVNWLSQGPAGSPGNPEGGKWTLVHNHQGKPTPPTPARRGSLPSAVTCNPSWT